jgi:DNA repair protein RadD
MLVHEKALFTDIAYETAMSDLIEAGYLSPLVSKSGKSKPNLTLVSTRAGEYNLEEMERAFNRYDIVDCAVLEIIKHGAGRKAWLLFTSGVQHAESVGKALEKGGIAHGIITGDTPPMIRASLLEDYKKGTIQALVGVDVFTTGFDVPKVDLIAVLRATKSVGLWVQICGRGTRKAEGKESCLVLDFGGNALAHGPVDCINIKRRWNPLTGKDESFLEKVPVKECMECGAILAINARECSECGVVFPIIARISHGPEASSAPIMSGHESLFVGTVQSVRYEKHTSKKSGGISMRVDYLLVYDPAVPTARISEYVLIGRDGFQGIQATKWWYEHGASLDDGTPSDVDESVARAPAELLSPKKIEFKRDGKYWRVNKVIEFHARGQGGPITIEEEEEFFDDTGINL